MRRHLLRAICGVLGLAGVPALTAVPAAADGGPIMPLSAVAPGMNCVGETVVQGTAISSFNVHVIDIVQDPVEGPRILVSVSGPAVDATGVAEGMSGSPVYCTGANGIPSNIGAISEGIGQYGNNVVLVTPIQQMLGEPVSPPSSTVRMTIRGTPLATPLSVGGLSPSVFGLLQRAGRQAGRVVTAVPAASSLSFPTQPLVPGAAVSTSYSSGTVPIGAIGTVTYRDGQTVYAFGHPFDGAGRRSLLLQDAYVYYVVGNPNVADNTSYKLAAAGHTEGTLTSDTPNAVIGEVGPAPATIPVDVIAHDLDTGATLTQSTQVADETDIGVPTGGSLLDLVAPLAVAQGATQIYDGPPASETGRLCLSVSVREIRGPLKFCNRYVSTGAPGPASEIPPALALSASFDTGTAIGLIDQEQFANLHVTHVVARIDAQRGLHEAQIVSASAPTVVKAGERITIRLRVRPFRAAIRTIAFKARVPRDLLPGRVTAKIVNPAEVSGASSSSALAAILTVALGGPGSGSGGLGGSQAPSTSVSALRTAFSKVGFYDGLDLRFSGEKPAHVFRDPALLINGRAKLAFRVVR